MFDNKKIFKDSYNLSVVDKLHCHVNIRYKIEENADNAIVSLDVDEMPYCFKCDTAFKHTCRRNKGRRYNYTHLYKCPNVKCRETVTSKYSLSDLMLLAKKLATADFKKKYPTLRSLFNF
ncbi:MAG: hypothetical protein ACYSSI_10605 [Planctomycetota bacterium]|jgi:hypothetical protein